MAKKKAITTVEEVIKLVGESASASASGKAIVKEEADKKETIENKDLVPTHPFEDYLPVVKIKALTEPTPSKYIYKRPGRGGLDLSYVSIGYVTNKLNEVFGMGWTFQCAEVSSMEMIAKTGNIVVKGTLDINVGGRIFSRTQYGSAEIKFHTRGDRQGRPVDIGDDFKSAASDALKKCASMFGVANDVYFKDWSELPHEPIEPAGVQPPSPATAGAPAASGDSAPKAVAPGAPTPLGEAKVVEPDLSALRKSVFTKYHEVFRGDKVKMIEALKGATGIESFMALTKDHIEPALAWLAD